jgi:glycosyltransferase involved in cell wall biosynthesis
MKISFIGQKGIPAVWGGVEEHVDHLSRELVKAGLEVEVYVRRWYTPSRLKDYEGVDLIQVPTLKTKHLDAAVHSLLCTLHALTRGADILHYQAIGPAAFALLPRLLGKTIVVTIHSRDWKAGKWGPLARQVLKACEALAVKLPRRTIVVSRTIQEDMRARYGLETTVIPNGTAAPVFRPARRIRELWGLEPGSYALHLGRLVPEKRATWLIESFRDLRKSRPVDRGYKLVIAGGSDAAGGYTRRLETLAAGETDVIMAGTVHGELKAELLSQAGLFLQPSRHEGHPIALLEAQSYGLCCLASDIPPHREIIRDGWNGRLFRAGEQADLTARWAEILADPEETAAMGRRAGLDESGRWTWERVAAGTRDLYEQLTVDGPAGRRR